MTEQLGESNDDMFEQIPTDFESTLVDPYIKRLFTQAREYAELVSQIGNTTAEERAAMIHELDINWPYYRQQLTISGAITSRRASDGQVVKEYYDGETMVSDGFCFVADHLMIDDEIVQERYRVAHHLLKLVNAEENKYRVCTGELDEVVFDYPTHSPELVENRLRYYYAGMMEDLDSLILNCNTEEDAMIALKDFKLEASPEDPSDNQMLKDLDAYLASTLDVDDQLPYAFKVEGQCFVVQEDGSILRANFNETIDALVMIKGVNLLGVGDTSDRKKVPLLPVVNVDFYEKGSTRNVSHLYIPCSSVIDAYSVRRFVANED